MEKKLYRPLIWLIVLSMLLAACQTAAPVATTQAVVVEPTLAPTPVPPTPEPSPTPEPPTDWMAVFTEAIAAMSPDKGYGSVAAAKLNEELAEKPPFIVDVREVAEVEKDGYIKDSINIPVRELLKNLDKLPGLDEPIVVTCASGHRGGLALVALRTLGYTNVRNLGGGIGAWKKAGLPTETGAPAAAPAISTPIVADAQLFTGLDEFLTNLPENFLTVKSDKLNELLGADPKPFLLDVRSDKEYNEQGYIEGATHILYENVLTSLDQLPAQDQPIVVYCASGHRGAIIMMALKFLGYTDVSNLAGGLNAWKAAQMPVKGWVDWSKTWGDFLAALPKGYYAVPAADVNAALADQPPFLLDVREAAELEKDGFIAGSVNIPMREVMKNLDKLPAQDQPIVVLCGSGHRGAMIMAGLRLLGYTDVVNIAGGLGAWKKAELPVETGVPAAPVAGTAPAVNEDVLKGLDAYFTGLPEGFAVVKPADLNVELGAADKPFMLDVRTAEEYTGEGYIESAVNAPVVELWNNLASLPTDKATSIVTYCKSGHRAAIAMMALRMTGYTNVRNLGGGMNAWLAAELPVAGK